MTEIFGDPEAKRLAQENELRKSAQLRTARTPGNWASFAKPIPPVNPVPSVMDKLRNEPLLVLACLGLLVLVLKK